LKIKWTKETISRLLSMFRERKRKRKRVNRRIAAGGSGDIVVGEARNARYVRYRVCDVARGGRTNGLSGFRDKEFVELWPGSFDRRHGYRTCRVRPAHRRSAWRVTRASTCDLSVLARVGRKISREWEREVFSIGESIASQWISILGEKKETIVSWKFVWNIVNIIIFQGDNIILRDYGGMEKEIIYLFLRRF